MPIPSALVTRFFQLVVDRHFAEANRELKKIQEKMHKSEWNRGYIRALRGMLIEEKSSSGKYAFLSELDFNDKQALEEYRREFQTHVKSQVHEDFDRGYFSAWAECMRVLSKLAVNKSETVNGENESQAKLESYS